MPFQRKLVVPTCLVEQLPEEITITEGFATQIRVVVNLSWQLTVIIIVIQFTGKTIGGIHVPKETEFAMSRVHPTVGATIRYGIVAIRQFIGIIVVSIDILSNSTEGETVGDILLVTHKRTHIAKGTEAHLRCNVRLGVVGGQTKRLNIKDRWC